MWTAGRGLGADADVSCGDRDSHVSQEELLFLAGCLVVGGAWAAGSTFSQHSSVLDSSFNCWPRSSAPSPLSLDLQ